VAVLLVDARNGRAGADAPARLPRRAARHPPHRARPSTRWTWSATRASASSAIVADFQTFAAPLGFAQVQPIPMSALEGDMVVERGQALELVRRPDAARIPRGCTHAT
jgi:hypothetical protein